MDAVSLRDQYGECGQCAVVHLPTGLFWPFLALGLHAVWTAIFYGGAVAYEIFSHWQASHPGFVFGVGAVGALVAALFTFLFIVFDLLLINAYITSSVIGRYYYFFRDEDGHYHMHRNDPTQPADRWYQWWEEHQKQSPVLRVRHGGWFKRSLILPPFNEYWQVYRNWAGFTDLLLINRDSWAIIGNIRFRELYDLILNHRDYGSYLANPEAEPVMNHLGRTIFTILSQINHNRETIGRSEHARAIRLHLERALAVPPMDTFFAREKIAEWQRRTNPTTLIPIQHSAPDNLSH